VLAEFHQIRYFQAVAESRSFTTAAKREHVSQPTLSHQVLKLESELGAKLFHRMGRKVELTAFGEAFLPKAETILRELKLAKAQIREMAGAETGSVTVGVIPTITPFFMPELSEVGLHVPIVPAIGGDDERTEVSRKRTTGLSSVIPTGLLDIPMLAIGIAATITVQHGKGT
jgi:LysR family hydrogen peroxide-inducible transcriptional activator